MFYILFHRLHVYMKGVSVKPSHLHPITALGCGSLIVVSWYNARGYGCYPTAVTLPASVYAGTKVFCWWQRNSSVNYLFKVVTQQRLCIFGLYDAIQMLLLFLFLLLCRVEPMTSQLQVQHSTCTTKVFKTYRLS